MTSSDADERGNWLALLKWSLKNSNDGTNPDTNPASVSEEDRAFLENAMKQVQNTPERLRVIMEELIAMLNSTSPSSSADALANRNDVTEALLDELEEIIEDIDFAQIFVKFGGTKCLIQTAKESEGNGLTESNRAKCVGVIGTIAQNNLEVQDILLKDGLIPVLMSFREDRNASSSSGVSSHKVWSKALYALGSIVKNHAAAEVLFIQHYAASAFRDLTDEKFSNDIKRRCVYLALFLVSQDISRVPSLITYFIPALYDFVKDPNDTDLREGSLQLLEKFSRIKQGKQMISGSIERVFEERSQNLVFDEEYDDRHEKELIASIRTTLQADPEADAPATNAEEDSAPASNILMIEPLQLNAASKAP